MLFLDDPNFKNVWLKDNMKKSIEIKMSEFLHSFFLNFFTVCLLYQHINFSYFLSSFVNSKYCTLSYTNFMNKIQGIGAGFVPDVLNTKVYDEIYKAEADEAFATAKLLAHKEGILVGISSGAALSAAIEYAKKPENKGKVIVALLPDTGDRYYSTALFTE